VIPTVLLIWLISATLGFEGAARSIGLTAAVVWILIWAAVAYFIWYKHHHDLWVVTDQRLLDVYKSNFFKQRVSSADLVNVQDISIEKGGILATLFNFGDVRCQTAGAQTGFVLSGIPNPARILTRLDAARDAARQVPRDGAQSHAPGDVVPGTLSPDRPPVRDGVPRSS
jgi:membrane protein YdbS with pleckstrin-like domain